MLYAEEESLETVVTAFLGPARRVANHPSVRPEGSMASREISSRDNQLLHHDVNPKLYA